MGIYLKKEHLLADLSAIMSSELQILCTDVFPQIPIQLSADCTLTDTLHYEPIWFFDRTFHKTKSQNNRQPYIDCHSRHIQPIPPSVILLSTFALTPSVRESVGPLPILLGVACPLLRAGA